ncbi:MAG TPA: methylenetetrahydrofolate reductase [Bacillota bacterium]
MSVAEAEKAPGAQKAPAVAAAKEAASSPFKTESRLERLFAQGEFVVTAEIGPPKSASSKGIKENARLLKDATDGQNLTDNQTAIVRLSSIAAAVHVLSEGGNPIMQMVCRDRNRIAMQSDLLGAYSLGIRQTLCLSGDHQSFGNHPTAKNVYDIDSIQLIQAVKGLRDDKKFLSGDDCKIPPKFYIGAAANPFADPFEFRVLRLEKKIKAGADFIQTQAIFDFDRFEKFMAAVRERGLHQKINIMAGIIPVKSAKAMEYMKTVPGMIVPDDLIARIKGAADQAAAGVDLAVEMIQRVRKIEGVRGVHLMAVGWEEKVPEIVEKAGLLPRPKMSA